MWALVFLFDREKRRRRSILAALFVGVLTVISHLWLSGPWMQQAGLRIQHPPAARPEPAVTRSPFDLAGAAQDALAELAREARVPTQPRAQLPAPP
jgi:hypothetical protein